MHAHGGAERGGVDRRAERRGLLHSEYIGLTNVDEGGSSDNPPDEGVTVLLKPAELAISVHNVMLLFVEKVSLPSLLPAEACPFYGTKADPLQGGSNPLQGGSAKLLESIGGLVRPTLMHSARRRRAETCRGRTDTGGDEARDARRRKQTRKNVPWLAWRA